MRRCTKAITERNRLFMQRTELHDENENCFSKNPYRAPT